MQALQDVAIKVKAYDPVGKEQAKKVIDNVTYCEAMDGADAAVIVTEWDTFRALDLDRLKPLERSRAGRPSKPLLQPHRCRTPRIQVYRCRAIRGAGALVCTGISLQLLENHQIKPSSMLWPNIHGNAANGRRYDSAILPPKLSNEITRAQGELNSITRIRAMCPRTFNRQRGCAGGRQRHRFISRACQVEPHPFKR